jgi:hypothetical protein
MLKAGGAILEASPRYQAAVLAQKAKDAERARLAPKLVKPVVLTPVEVPEPKRKRAFSPRQRIDRAEVHRLICLDMTPQQIADKLGFAVETVLKASFYIRNKTLSPEKAEMLARAVKLRAKGYSYAKMAGILGVHRSSLHKDFIKGGLA